MRKLAQPPQIRPTLRDIDPTYPSCPRSLSLSSPSHASQQASNGKYRLAVNLCEVRGKEEKRRFQSVGPRKMPSEENGGPGV